MRLLIILMRPGHRGRSSASSEFKLYFLYLDQIFLFFPLLLFVIEEWILFDFRKEIVCFFFFFTNLSFNISRYKYLFSVFNLSFILIKEVLFLSFYSIVTREI